MITLLTNPARMREHGRLLRAANAPAVHATAIDSAQETPATHENPRAERQEAQPATPHPRRVSAFW